MNAHRLQTMHAFILKGCLRWSPRSRMSPEQGLNHPWITGEDKRRRRPRAPRYEHAYRRAHRAGQVAKQKRGGSGDEAKCESKESEHGRGIWRARGRRDDARRNRKQVARRVERQGQAGDHGHGNRASKISKLGKAKTALPPLSPRQGETANQRHKRHNHRHNHRPQNNDDRIRASIEGTRSTKVAGTKVSRAKKAVRNRTHSDVSALAEEGRQHSMRPQRSGANRSRKKHAGGVSVRRRRLYEP